MRTGIVLSGLFWAALATAAEHPQQQSAQHAARRVDLDSVTALVITLASCAALHVAAAEVLDREQLQAHAATARRRAEVDQYTAMYLLAQDQVAKGGAPREPTSYTSYVEQLTAAAHDRMLVVVTSDDAASFKREEAACAELIPLEDEVLSQSGGGELRLARQ